MFKTLSNASEWRLIDLLFFILTFIVVFTGVAELSKEERKYNTCVEAGKQYINGNCVK